MSKTPKVATGQDQTTGISKSSVEFLYKGFDPVEPFQPGDFILIHRNMVWSRMIRFGQSLRYPKKYSYWNHCALIVSKDGDMVEALHNGLVRGHISKYRNYEYYLVRVGVTDDDAKEIVAFADYMVEHGAKYSVSILFSEFFTLLFGWRFVFGRVGTFICSGFVATALERAGQIFSKPSDYITPADLALHFNVDPKRGKDRLIDSRYEELNRSL